MNGNIQVEPSRVKLDKQGATSSKEEKTVDAIVRPQLTKHISIQSTPISIQSGLCCFVATGKSYEKFWEWGSGPPLLESFPVLPPPGYRGSTGQGGGSESGIDGRFRL
jgi:hypothetical protein